MNSLESSAPQDKCSSVLRKVRSKKCWKIFKIPDFFQKLCRHPLENFTSSHWPTNQNQMKTFNKAIFFALAQLHLAINLTNVDNIFTGIPICKFLDLPFVFCFRIWGGTQFSGDYLRWMIFTVNEKQSF